MRQTTSIIIMEILTGIVLVLGLLFGLLTWRLLSGPVSLNFVKDDIVSAVESTRGGRPVTFSDVSLEWMSDTRSFKIVAEDVSFLSLDNQEVGSAERALIDLNAFSLIKGTPELNSIELENGNLTVLRTFEGELLFADQKIPAVYPVQFHEASNTVQYVEQSLLNIIDNLSQSDVFNRVDFVEFSAFDITVIDEKSDWKWLGSDVNIRVETDEDTINIAGLGFFLGDGAPEKVELTSKLDRSARLFDASLRFTNMELTKLPVWEMFGLSVEGTSQGDLLTQVSADSNGVQSVSTMVSMSPGELMINGKPEKLGQNDLTVFYDVPENTLLLDVRQLDLGRVGLNGQVRFNDASAIIEGPLREPHRVDVDLYTMTLDMTPTFSEPTNFRDVTLDVVLDFQKRLLNILNAEASIKDATFVANGSATFPADTPEGHLPFGLNVRATSEGVIDPEDVLQFWPVNLGSGARGWVENNVLQGDISNTTVELSLQPDSLIKGYLDNDDLMLDFEFSDARVSFLSDLPPIQAGRGAGRLQGNSFSLSLSSGEFGGWGLSSGTVLLPQFMPKGSEMRVFANGSGEIVEMMETISRSRLQLEARHGFDPDILSGQGEVEFRLRRPMLSDVSYEDTKFEVDAKLSQGGVEGVFRDLDFSNAYATLKMDNNALTISGLGSIEDSPVQFLLQDAFRSDADNRTKLSATGVASVDVLNKVGFPARAYIEGDIATQLEATGRSIGTLDDVELNLDLKDNRIDFSEFGWFKPKGADASAQLGYQGDSTSNSVRLSVSAEDFLFAGDLQNDDQDRMTGVRLDRLFLKDQMDLSGTLSRTGNKGLKIIVDGPYLNLEPYIGGMFSAGGGRDVALFGEIDFKSEVDRVDLKKDFALNDVDLSLSFAGPKLTSLNIDGETDDGSNLQASIQEMPGDIAQLSAKVDDAGGLLRGVFGFDFIEGGVLEATGVLRPGDQTSELFLNISETKIQNAPFLTQVLALASLRGLSDVLSGEGIFLSKIEVPLLIDERGYYINGAKASGPAMGFTANGHIKDSGDELKLSGVLVPSFGMNSALGEIPIIGDLFVSRDGEGVFAINYDVTGSTKEANVSVNPLTGLLPGVLRRIFENPIDDADVSGLVTQDGLTEDAPG